MIETTGIPTCTDIEGITPDPIRLMQGPVAVIECFQNIPCNPCAEACVRGAIRPFTDINDRPELNEAVCNGCGICLTRCPGLSIFVVDYTFEPHRVLIKIPFEFVPLPVVGSRVDGLNRDGTAVGEAEVIRVQVNANKTAVLWIAVPKELAMEVRNIRLKGGAEHGG